MGYFSHVHSVIFKNYFLIRIKDVFGNYCKVKLVNSEL